MSEKVQASGFIIFFRQDESSAPLFLVVKDRAHNNWGFPKGHVEQGESLIQAATRETKEEVGISDLKIYDGFEEKITYKLSDGREKEVTYFLAEAKNKDVTLNDELTDYAWLLTYEAIGRVTFVDTALLVDKARNFLFDLQEQKREKINK